MKIAWHNVDAAEDADFIVVGCGSEEGSRFEGAAKGPEAIRKASLDWLSGEWVDGTHFRYVPQGKFSGKGVFDFGDVQKEHLSDVVEDIALRKRVPIVLGGDHSLTFESVKGLSRVHKNMSIVFIDAHPDFTSRGESYYGSVMSDLRELETVNLKKSVLLGIRGATEHEQENISASKINVVPSIAFAEHGVKKIFSEIKKAVGKKVFVSVDLDVLDPAFAPGVSDPVPGGISSNELVSLCKLLATLKPVGFDVMELVPDNDVRDRTASLAAKLVSEIIGSYK